MTKQGSDKDGIDMVSKLNGMYVSAWRGGEAWGRRSDENGEFENLRSQKKKR